MYMNDFKMFKKCYTRFVLFWDNLNMSNEEIINNINNSSGQGKISEVPQDVINKFNWGAFFLNWIWGIGNKVYIAPIVFIAVIFILVLAVIFIKILGPISVLLGPICIIFSIFFCYWLGKNGNKFAWQNKKWKSVEEFHKIQKIWAIAGLLFFILLHIFRPIIISIIKVNLIK